MEYVDHGREMGVRLTPDEAKRAMQCLYDLQRLLARRERRPPPKRRRRRTP